MSSLPQVAEWGEKVAHLLESLQQLDMKAYELLERIHRDFTNPVVTITFGGPWKAGKSTMLNVALGRALLPMDELPETGTICVLRGGDQDTSVIRTSDGIRHIPCTTESIREHSSLLSESGTRRAVRELGTLIEITLKSSRIRNETAWTDSPGINDNNEMTARASEAAIKADVLLWVTNSNRYLGTEAEEKRLLSRFIESHGESSIVFVVNAFLSDDSPNAWEEFKHGTFRKNNEAAHRQRINDSKSVFGFSDDYIPPLVSVCAHSALKEGNGSFGASVLHETLQALSSPNNVRVLCSRLRRCVKGLQELSATIRASMAQLLAGTKSSLPKDARLFAAARLDVCNLLVEYRIEDAHKMLKQLKP